MLDKPGFHDRWIEHPTAQQLNRPGLSSRGEGGTGKAEFAEHLAFPRRSVRRQLELCAGTVRRAQPPPCTPAHTGGETSFQELQLNHC